MKSLIQRHQIVLSISILLLGLGWIGITAVLFNETTDGFIPAPKEGFIAPNFSLQTSSGGTYSLSDYRGQVVLINFWASWCPPCRTEMPAMQRVFEAYKDQDFVIFAVNATHQDSPGKAVEFSEVNGLTFPILFDYDGMVTSQYLVRSFPTSFFIDRDGIVHEVVIGGPMAEALLKTRVQALIEGEN